MKHKLLFLFLLITIPLFSQNKTQSIGFKENKGQIIDQNGKPNTAVKYLLNTNGLGVQLKKNGFSYDVYEVKKTPVVCSSTTKKIPYAIPEKDDEGKEESNLEYIFHRIDIDFLNSNSKVELITEQKSTDFDNYYNIPNKPEGIIGVHQYKQITYKNIYPNIDVVFTIPDDPKKTVEYNFVIHPKGNISDIQLKFNGAETNLVNNKIQMNVRFGKMEETLPASWIEEKGHKKEILVGYRKIKKDIYGFRSANFLRGKTVVIDPVPTRLWGTFYGGQDWTESNTLDKDDLGNIYFGGKTASVSTIATLGSHQSSASFTKYPGYITWDGYIAKFDANGNRIWATYYGGNYDDNIKSIKVSQNKDLVFCGNTNSLNNISTIGSFKENKSGSYSEMFLGKLNSNGVRQWATYYGNDNGLTFANSVSVDQQNNIYLSGATTSDEFISTPNSFKETRIDNNRFDGFLAKFDRNGNRIWGTYFGGDKDDSFEDSAIDKDGNIILVGYTLSENNIATANSYQPSYHVGDLASAGDGMIVKFDPNGQRIWSTYFGGIKSDWIYTCKIYGDNLYITGKTENNNISTPDTFEPTMKSSRSSYFAKFNLNTQKLAWLSYCQGDATSIYPKNDSEVFVTGISTYGFEIACSNAYNPVNRSFSGFILKLDGNCRKTWGTYFGTTNVVRDPIIISEGTSNIFVTGSVFSGFADYDIASPGAFIEVPNGSPSGFLIKFQDLQQSLTPSALSNSPICIGETLELKASGGTSYLWTGPNGFTSNLQNPNIPNTSAINSGEYSCTILGTDICDNVKKINVVIQNTSEPTGNINQSFCTGQNLTISNIEITGTSIKWYDALTNGSLLSETTTLENGKTYYASQTENNCESPRFGVTVSIVNTPSVPSGAPEQSFCKKENKTLNDIQIMGQNIKWFDTMMSASTLPNTTLLENNKTYYASQTVGCESDRTPILVHVYDTPLPTGNNNQQFCIDEIAIIEDLNINGTALKWYDSALNGNLLSETTLLQNAVYYVSQTLNNCESERLAITVKIQDTQIPSSDSPQQFCIQKNAKISDIDIIGQNIKWYESSSSTNNLFESTSLEDGVTYYASQTISNCESDRVPVTINILATIDQNCINLVDELPYPKFFTPNEDGFNDTWTINPSYLAPNSSIRIFNRYGKLLKELAPNTAWDGTFIGHLQPATDYWFTVTRINGTEFRGHFTLKR
ncbi:gliding motility-associated-like protein [Flavobacterium nitrogenifigens]|uniref:Gliding motility-associated-like protein n=2 Tax=Flavobacterium TaxID=237 RepID=A0A7W7IVM8_9FLAO|nr:MULTISPECIES: T9SS type B sorting domain-containing protein [Flavobacterium]MBB4801428.1 gliding motility-associated-like protein [Flavobacterium nitrogenifigens]MBB6386385.1 gliding motility-associated-like protein [Flavobacterium notoginsengisoli]